MKPADIARLADIEAIEAAGPAAFIGHGDLHAALTDAAGRHAGRKAISWLPSADLAQPFEAMLWNVVTAPRETPLAVMKQLADATGRVLADAALRRSLESQAMFADPHLGQAAATAYVQAERTKWKPIVATLGDLTTG